MTQGRGTRAGVKSDETLFAILARLREAGRAGVTDLAEELDVAKSTVHSHLATMRERGLVVKAGREYRLGLEWFSYGQAVRNQVDVYRAGRTVLDDLEDATGEMVWLVVPEGGRIMFVYGRAGRTEVDVNTILGSWDYMHCTAGGKAILAYYPDTTVDRIVAEHGLPTRTDNTIADREALADELRRVRERGYALNMGEDLEGIRAVAVPLRYEGTVRGAIAVAGPAHRISRERAAGELADALFASTNDIEVNLAYT